MIIVEKNAGQKIDYDLNGTKLSFADDELVLNLARYQRDYTVTKDVMLDSEGYLTTGRGDAYIAQVEIPEIEYEEETETVTEEDGEGNEVEREVVTRTALPLDTDKVTLYLFSIEGLIIQ